MYAIGITAQGEDLQVAILRKDRTGVALESFETLPNVKLFYNLPPFQTGKEVQITTGLPGTDVFIRKLLLPLNDKRKILATLPFQLEALLPFPGECAVICPLLQPISRQMTAVTLIATKRDFLEKHLSAMGDLKPDVVSCYPAALARYTRWLFPSHERILSFHLSNQTLLWVLSEGEEILLSQTLHLDSPLDLEKLATFLKQKGEIDDHTPYLLTGTPSGEESQLWSNYFKGPEKLPPHPDTLPYALAIGLALDALKANGSSVQFCEKTFTPPKRKEARKHHSLTYLAVCGAAALMMALSSAALLSKKKKLLSDTLSTEFPSAQGPLEERLLAWEKSLAKQKSPFPFVSTAPKVSDLLAYLSTHPALSTPEGLQKEGIEIKNLHYELVKHPKIGETHAPYLATVEIEFTATSPRLAREFHEALLKGDGLVNAKKEVKWHAQSQTYYTSFELNRSLSQ
ncbi:MAG: hypothetical protein JSS61_02530 [Verrucomicrobia bacterium]|nr:hypothetical protein [Verrucomicrobiota bacterium]